MNNRLIDWLLACTWLDTAARWVLVVLLAAVALWVATQPAVDPLMDLFGV